jgi:hypothetical protein
MECTGKAARAFSRTLFLRHKPLHLNADTLEGAKNGNFVCEESGGGNRNSRKRKGRNHGKEKAGTGKETTH